MPKRQIDFASLATSGTQEIILADRVELISWRELTLKIRVHNHTLTGSNAITVTVYSQSWTDEDPGIQFVTSTAAATWAINSSTPVPGEWDLTIPTLGTNAVAGMARITAVGSRAGAGTMQAALSLEMSVKNA
jgi:hypothetical protein